MRAVTAILLFMSCVTAGAETAETIFINGNIYTVNDKQPFAHAIAVKGDRIIFVGANADAEQFRGDKTRIVDLAGKTVTPGFTYSLCHIFGIGEREMTLNLEGTNTREDLVAKNIPKPTEAETEQALLKGIDREIKLGWCEIQNAGSELSDQEIIRRAFAARKVKLRMINAAYGPGEAANALLKNGVTLNAFDHRFTQRTIKVIFDGALGSRGAALLAPYSDKADTSGFLTQNPEELRPMFEEALRRGIQVETHAIGDRANRLILDLYEQAFKAVPPDKRPAPGGGASSGEPGVAERRPPRADDVRWRVEHAQILTEQDLPRFAKLGVIASMQPSHAISDLFFAPSRLGMERLAGAYAWNSLLKSGAIICGGSDAPVERGEPMIEFYAAATRKSIKGESGEGWHPEQAVSREQALRMFTSNAAYAAFEENDKGSIEVGKLADFTVLSADIMKIPGPEILKTRCEMTVIGGEIVYDTR